MVYIFAICMILQMCIFYYSIISMEFKVGNFIYFILFYYAPNYYSKFFISLKQYIIFITLTH